MTPHQHLPDLATAARALNGEVEGGEIRFPPPGHSAKDRSASLRYDASAPDGFVVHCFSPRDDPLSVKDYARDRLGLSTRKPANGHKAKATTAPQRKKVAEYDYRDETGALLFQVVRYQPKDFRQRRPDPDKPGEWIWSIKDVRRVPYRLQALLEAGHDNVIVVEGERDADNLAAEGYTATTNAAGAGKWTADLNHWFKGRHVSIIPDRDEPGAKHAQQVAASLHGIAASVRIVDLPGTAKDVSDWIKGGGDPDELPALCEAAPLWSPDTAPEVEPDTEPEPQTKALAFVAFGDIQVDVRKPWIMKGAIARGETSSWIGGPGKGKSALLTDLALHVAAGRDWRDHRMKERCAVVILAYERADLMLRRLEAYKRRHEFQDLPIVIIRASLDIMRPESVDVLVDTIRAVERRFNLPVGVLGVDTYSKAIALGGGDENQARDVNRFMGHLRLVQAQTNVHVALVGHTGKDETKGHRGSNAHLGDVDVEVTINGDTVKSAIVTKANDQPEGSLTTYTLETFSFGHDEDGDPITTSILSDDAPERQAKQTTKRGPSPREKIALDALTEALIGFGKEAPPSYQMSRDVRVVDAGHWKEELFRRGALDRDMANPRVELKRIREGLIDKGLIGFRDELVWKVHP